MDAIARPQSEAEKDLKSGGFKDIRYWQKEDYQQKQLGRIAEEQQEFVHKKRVPFCNKCAYKAVEKKIDEINEQVAGKTDIGELRIDATIEYKQFAGEDKFERLDDQTIKEVQILAGVKQTTITGKYKCYKCKKCGGGMKIEFSNIELEQSKNK